MQSDEQIGKRGAIKMAGRSAMGREWEK